jgi:hypothetical protein
VSPGRNRKASARKGILQSELSRFSPTVAALLFTGAFAAAIISAVAHVAGIAKLHAQHMQEYAKAARVLAAFDKSKLYVPWSKLYVRWESAIPLQSIYPVFGSMAAVRDFRWYGIGWGSLAPFAMAHLKDVSGGLPRRLAAGDAIPFIATIGQMNLLSTYCE